MSAVQDVYNNVRDDNKLERSRHCLLDRVVFVCQKKLPTLSEHYTICMIHRTRGWCENSMCPAKEAKGSVIAGI